MLSNPKRVTGITAAVAAMTQEIATTTNLILLVDMLMLSSSCSELLNAAGINP
jgi:hypothetical protein